MPVGRGASRLVTVAGCRTLDRVREQTMDDDSFDGFAFDDDSFDEDELLEAWAQAERQAADVLVGAIADAPQTDVDDHEVGRAANALRAAHAQGHHGARWMLRAAGIGVPEDVDDQALLVRSAAATISMVEDPGLPTEEAASIMTLDLADWLGAIIGLVRAGPGAPADPETLVDLGQAVEELDAPLDPEDRELVELGFELVLPAWQACGAVDDDHRVTELGCWLLPTAAVEAWTGGAGDGDGPGPDDGSNVIPFPGPADSA